MTRSRIARFKSTAAANRYIGQVEKQLHEVERITWEEVDLLNKKSGALIDQNFKLERELAQAQTAKAMANEAYRGAQRVIDDERNKTATPQAAVETALEVTLEFAKRAIRRAYFGDLYRLLDTAQSLSSALEVVRLDTPQAPDQCANKSAPQAMGQAQTSEPAPSATLDIKYQPS